MPEADEKIRSSKNREFIEKRTVTVFYSGVRGYDKELQQ